MRVTVTGATGLVGRALVGALRRRGDEVTILSRRPGAAGDELAVEAIAWDPSSGPAPAAALTGRDAVVHLAGAPVAQRWSAEAKRQIRTSREQGTANLVAGLAATPLRPGTLVSASAVGYYGPRGDEEIGEETEPGTDFLAEVCVVWEREAAAAEQLGMRVVRLRTGVVLDPDGGALAKMVTPFKLGLGGPVAGGRQVMQWIDRDDLVALYLAAIDDQALTGPYNATAPTPVTNADFSKALGRALHRPAIVPIPRFALALLYGEMEQIVTTGQRAVPRRLLSHGHRFEQTDLDAALRNRLG